MRRIQQVFDRFDKDGGGSLDRNEMQWLGCDQNV